MGERVSKWINHIEWIVLMGTIIGGVYAIDAKIERQICEVRREGSAQSQRTDKLYEMFIELVKERK